MTAVAASAFLITAVAGAAAGINSDCCPVQDSTGCSVAAVEQKVCAIDGFCCTTQWDEQCYQESSKYCPSPACSLTFAITESDLMSINATDVAAAVRSKNWYLLKNVSLSYTTTKLAYWPGDTRSWPGEGMYLVAVPAVCEEAALMLDGLQDYQEAPISIIFPPIARTTRGTRGEIDEIDVDNGDDESNEINQNLWYNGAPKSTTMCKANNAPTEPTAAVVKDGDNGSVDCNTFCTGSEWQPVFDGCAYAYNTQTQESLPCNFVPGTLPPGQELTCYCSNTPFAPNMIEQSYSVSEPTVYIGSPSSGTACLQLCQAKQAAYLEASPYGASACAYQCNGCWIGQSAIQVSASSNAGCWQYAWNLEAPQEGSQNRNDNTPNGEPQACFQTQNVADGLAAEQRERERREILDSLIDSASAYDGLPWNVLNHDFGVMEYKHDEKEFEE